MIRAAGVLLYALTAYVPCLAGCGKWGRWCGVCGKRRWSPLLYRGRA